MSSFKYNLDNNCSDRYQKSGLLIVELWPWQEGQIRVHGGMQNFFVQLTLSLLKHKQLENKV